MGCGNSGPHVEMTTEEKNGHATFAIKELWWYAVSEMCDEAKGGDEKWEKAGHYDTYKVYCPKHEEMMVQLAKFNEDAAAKKIEEEGVETDGMKEKMAAKAKGLACSAMIAASDKIKKTLEVDIAKKFSDEARKVMCEKDFRALYKKVIDAHKVQGALELATGDPYGDPASDPPREATSDSCWVYLFKREEANFNSEEMRAVVEKQMNSGIFGGALPKAAQALQDGWAKLSEKAAEMGLTLELIEFSIEQYMVDETVKVFQKIMEDKEKQIRSDVGGDMAGMARLVKIGFMTKAIKTVFSEKDHTLWKICKGVPPIDPECNSKSASIKEEDDELTKDAGDTTATKDAGDTTATKDAGDTTATKDATPTKEAADTTAVKDATPTKEAADTTAVKEATPTKEAADTTAVKEATPTKEAVDITAVKEATPTKEAVDITAVKEEEAAKE